MRSFLLGPFLLGAGLRSFPGCKRGSREENVPGKYIFFSRSDVPAGRGAGTAAGHPAFLPLDVDHGAPGRCLTRSNTCCRQKPSLSQELHRTITICSTSPHGTITESHELAGTSHLE